MTKMDYEKILKSALQSKETPFEVTSWIEEQFPELAESEDDNICKNLIAFLKQCRAVYGDGFKQFGLDIDDALAWLEKQGEKKPVISDDALREGIAHFGITQYQIDNWLKKYVDIEKQTEQKLYVNDNAKEMFIKALERVEEQNNKGYKLTDCDKNSWWENFKAYTSCTIEQKSAAWSDEDEKMLVEIVKDLQVCKSRDISRAAKDAYQNEIDWLKSLKERYTWRPSDEQMIVLNDIIINGHLSNAKEILKKLREE